MMSHDCDTMRDLLPLYVRGAVLPHEQAAAEQHIASCADCAQEASIIRLLQQSIEPVPAGLEDRVLSAVRAPQPRTARRFVPARLAMAATVTLAVIGGALAIDRYTAPPADGEMMLAEFELPSAMVGWVVDSDPLLHGGATLDELTVEELEILLAELES